MTISNTNFEFLKKKLIWRFYITNKALSFTKYIKYINKKKFIKIALDENVEAYIIYITFFNLSLILIYPAKKV